MGWRGCARQRLIPTAACVKDETMSEYTRFIVLTYGRSGSMWLVEALNSHPQIVCFGSVFEAGADFVSFDVAGYDNFSANDRGLRDSDFRRFLEDRVFCDQPPEVCAVGFKLQYKNVYGFPGLLPHLRDDRELKIVHLKRRNALRSLVSLLLAKETGQYHRQPVRLGWERAALALRHPARAVTRLRMRMRKRTYTPPTLTLTREECERFFHETEWSEAHFDNLFAEHGRVDVVYEELVSDPEAGFARVLEFLGVEARPLISGQERLNPISTRQLVGNFDELRESFAGTKYQEFFA